MNYSVHAKVIQGLRDGADACKHYKSFSKRMCIHFEKALPGFTIRIVTDNDSSGKNSVRVSGNGLTYDEAVDVGIRNNSENWFEDFNNALDIASQTDYAERALDEESLVPVLEELNAKVEALQEEARKLYSTLPIPRSAKVRAAAHFWEAPSHQMCKRFPKLFND